MGVAADRKWTPTEDARLASVYGAYPPPDPVPWTEVEGFFPKRTRAALKARAFDLGLMGGRKPKAATKPRVCEGCGCPFSDAKNGKTRFCTVECGNRGKWTRNEHPKGAAGLVFDAEALAKISAATQRRWDEATAEERAEMLRPMHEAPTPPRNGNTYSRTRSGKRADLGGLFVRSSWEANYARWLSWLVQRGEILSWAYEPRTFDFPVKRGNRSYTPDFLVTRPDGSAEWHEVKGWMDDSSRVKLDRFARHYPDEVLVLIDAAAYRALAKDVSSLIPGWE